jgi:hypothetical protein
VKRGLAAEFAELDELVVALRVVRACGIERVEAYTPYPVPELDDLLGARPSPLSLVAAAGAICGAAGGYGLQWLLDAYLYPVNAGGRPPHMPLAFVIIALEMGFLVAGLAVFFGNLYTARLVTLWAPIADTEGFESATRAGFWLALDAADPRYDERALSTALRATGPTRLQRFGGEP